MKMMVRFAVLAAVTAALLAGTAPPASAWVSSVSGRVVDVDGQPVSGITVVLANSTGEVIDGRPRAVTDGEGSYRFAARLFDPVTVVVIPSDDDFAGTREYLSLIDTSGEDLVVDDLIYHRKGSISGTVTLDAPSGEPTSVVVSTDVWGGWGLSYGQHQQEVRFVGSGTHTFRIEGVAAGSYRVAFGSSRSGNWSTYYPGSTTITDAEPVEVGPGEQVTGIDVSLSRLPDTVVGVGPTRLVDTRAGRPNGAITVPKTRIAPDRPLRLEVAGAAGVPANGAEAVALSVTAVGAVAGGHLSVVPCGAAATTSTLNFPRSTATSNTAIVALDATGGVCLHPSVETDVVVDLSGFVRAASGYRPLTPLRLVDTRPDRPALDRTIERTQVGPEVARSKWIRLDDITEFSQTDVLSLNVTATGAAVGGHVAIYRCHVPQPGVETSVLNYSAGATVANSMIFDLHPDPYYDDLCITSSTPVDVVVDVNGVFGRDSTFVGRSGEGRLYDTRSGRESRNPQVTGKIGGARMLRLPTAAKRGMVTYNVTVTNTGSSGYVTLYHCNRPRPTTSNLNYSAGATVASLVHIPVPADRTGEMCLYAASMVDVIIDSVGVFSTY